MKTYIRPRTLQIFDTQGLITHREQADMSQVELGVQLYMLGFGRNPSSRQRISTWETGVCAPSALMLRGLAEVFEVSMESFFIEANKGD